MCGIIGYVGRKPAQNILLDGLRRLEYRGYDSAGVCIIGAGRFQVRKKMGRIHELSVLMRQQPAPGTTGIGHTRWATHGPPSDENSHPHLDQSGTLAVVHNGVIENCDALRQRLLKAGHRFQSATDTEVLAHLIGDHYRKGRDLKSDSNPLTQAVCAALREVIGTYGLAVISTEQPDTIVGA